MFHKVAVLKEFQLRRSDMSITTAWQKQPSLVGAAYRNYGRVSDCRAPRPRRHLHSYLYLLCGLFV